MTTVIRYGQYRQLKKYFDIRPKTALLAAVFILLPFLLSHLFGIFVVAGHIIYCVVISLQCSVAFKLFYLFEKYYPLYVGFFTLFNLMMYIVNGVIYYMVTSYLFYVVINTFYPCTFWDYFFTKVPLILVHLVISGGSWYVLNVAADIVFNKRNMVIGGDDLE